MDQSWDDMQTSKRRRWCFLGVCSILDAFQIFVVLEVKDLLHFQSTRTMRVCAGGEVMIIACCECLKSRDHGLGVKVLDVEQSWFVLGDSNVEGDTSEIYNRNSDGFGMDPVDTRTG